MNTDLPEEKLLDTKTVSQILSISISKLAKMVRNNEISAYRVGGEYRFERKEVRNYLERVKTGGTTPA